MPYIFSVMRQKICIFACGGHGTRMGENLPKQFLRLGSKTILQLSIERILEAVPDVRIITVLPAEYVDFWAKESFEHGLVVQQSISRGGITRFHSVRGALERVGDDEPSLVAIHDGVRPFVSAALVRNLFEKAENCPAVVPVIPVTDTLKVLQADPASGELRSLSGRSADRSVLYGAQTPQIFHSEVLKNAYMQPYDPAFTDDASVVERSGVPVSYFPGEKYNIKITVPEDLLLGRFLAGGGSL